MLNKNQIGKAIFIFAIFLLLSTFFIYFLGIIHEIAHFVSCEGFGGNASIEISLLSNPPKYITHCPELNSLSPLRTFIVISSPYWISALLMICFFIFVKVKNFVYLSFPTAILLGDWFNISDIIFKSPTISNDFFAAYLLLGKNFIYAMFFPIFLITLFYLMIIKKIKLVKPKKFKN